MPEDMPDTMPDRMPEDMSDRMPEDLPATKCTNVMVGITRSKVILKLPPPPCAVLLVPMFLSAQVSNGLESQPLCRTAGKSNWPSENLRLSKTGQKFTKLNSSSNRCS